MKKVLFLLIILACACNLPKKDEVYISCREDGNPFDTTPKCDTAIIIAVKNDWIQFRSKTTYYPEWHTMEMKVSVFKSGYEKLK